MIVTVSELNSYVKEFFELNPAFNDLFVKGEISNFKHHSSGHLYLTLKDDKASVKAVMFKFNACNLKFEPENGMKVIVSARASLYERDGAYQLYINDMQPDGIGALYLQFAKLKEKLEKEGIFNESIKKPIPKFPTRIGVVTSKTGAAVRDIINVIKRRYPICDIIIYPALVQGENAYKTIVAGIELFNRHKIDTIIIGRGGGSIEDLQPFNEEEVAYAIYNSKIPVISAVGHETDYTISDFAADLRAPTPSAAAELCVPDLNELKFNLNKMDFTLASGLKKVLSLNQIKLENIINNNVFKNPYRLIESKIENLLNSKDKLIEKYKNILSMKREKFIINASKLDSISPLKVLKRGYAFVYDDKSNIVTKSKDLNKGDNLNLQFEDGKIRCIVTEKENN